MHDKMIVCVALGGEVVPEPEHQNPFIPNPPLTVTPLPRMARFLAWTGDISR